MTRTFCEATVVHIRSRWSLPCTPRRPDDVAMPGTELFRRWTSWLLGSMGELWENYGKKHIFFCFWIAPKASKKFRKSPVAKVLWTLYRCCELWPWWSTVTHYHPVTKVQYGGQSARIRHSAAGSIFQPRLITRGCLISMAFVKEWWLFFPTLLANVARNWDKKPFYFAVPNFETPRILHKIDDSQWKAVSNLPALPVLIW